MSPGRTISGLLVPYGVFQQIGSPAEGGRFLVRWAFGAAPVDLAALPERSGPREENPQMRVV